MHCSLGRKQKHALLLNELSYLIIVSMAGLRSTVHRHLVQELEVLDFDTQSGLKHVLLSLSVGAGRAVVSYWGKYVHLVLVNHLGGLSLHRNSVIPG